LGIYAYRMRLLKQYSKLHATPLEQSEVLEQLRLLEHGHRIVSGALTALYRYLPKCVFQSLGVRR